MNPIIYKLTDENMRTYGGTQWVLGEWQEATGPGRDLCSDGWLHGYESPLVAVFMAPVHVGFTGLRLFEAGWDGEMLRDGPLKCGVRRMRVVREIELPVISTQARVRTAIRRAQRVWRDAAWSAWANQWLDGTDRSASASRSVVRSMVSVSPSPWTAEWSAARDALRSAEWASEWLAERDALRAAKQTAVSLAAEWWTAPLAAVRAAATWATAAVEAAAAPPIDLHALIEQSICEEREMEGMR